MSTKFYIKDKNGTLLSADGKVRYTMLKGKKLYKFLKTEDGKRRCFHTVFDDYGNKIGIEVEPEQSSSFAEQKERDRYQYKMKTKHSITVRSANDLVSITGEGEIERIQTLADEAVDIEADVLHRVDLETLREALKTLSEDEYKLIYNLFLAEFPMTEQEIADEIGLSQRGVSKRKQRVLLKLKKFF